MTLRAAHGKGAAALVRVETAVPDELPEGVHASLLAETGSERRADGRWVQGATTAQARGGKARAGKVKLASKLGLDPLPLEAFASYRRHAERFRREHCKAIAVTVGGGICGTGPSSMVASAALALAASRFLYDTHNGDAAKLAQAARLADSSRQQLLTAHELAAREAEARQKIEAASGDQAAAAMREMRSVR